MTSNEGFFARKQAAAVLKHGILSRYPTIFASMAGSGEPEVVLYDAYAGPGKYEDGSPGSPLLLVETAIRTANFRKVRLYFSEEDIDHHTELHRTLTEAVGSDVEWEAVCGTAERWAGAFVRDAADAPMFTFLDPFGVGLSYEVLTETLLGRPAQLKTEVLVNINVESVWRIGGRLQEIDSGSSPRTGAEATLERVDRFLGDTWWRGKFRRVRDASSAAAAAGQVVDEFCRRVQAATGFASFQVPICRRPGHPPYYILTLFYRHPFAPWKFNDSASSANEDWRRACIEEDLEKKLGVIPLTPSLFSDDAEAEELLRKARLSEWETEERERSDAWIDAISMNIERLLCERPLVNLGDDLVAVYGSTLGLARELHVRKAWDQLTERGVASSRDKKLRTLARGTVRRATSD